MTGAARGRFEGQAAALNDHDGVSICVDCGIVFEPKAKHGAKRCELCNRSSTAVPLFQRQDHPDGRGWTLASISSVLHLRDCAACDETFPAKTAATLYCCDACRKAGSRGQKRQNPGTVGWAPELRAAMAEATRAGLVAKLAAWQEARVGAPRLAAADLIAEVKGQRASAKG